MSIPMTRRVVDEVLSWPGMVSVAHDQGRVALQVGAAPLATLLPNGELSLSLTPLEWASWSACVNDDPAPHQDAHCLPLTNVADVARALELLRWTYRQRHLWT